MDSPSEYGAFCAFRKDQLVAGLTLVCPLMVVWREYKEYCSVWGFPQMAASRFVLMLEHEEGVTIKSNKSPRGRLNRYVEGIGFLRKEDHHVCSG